MKFELDLIKAQFSVEGSETLPVKPDRAFERKEVRQATDHVMHAADTLPALIAGCCVTMLAVAHCLERHDQEPDIQDFREASFALIEDARTVMDRGVMLDDMATMRAGAVMLELVVRGMTAALGQDYEECLRAVHEGREPPIRKPSGASDGNEREEQASDDAGGAVGDPRD